MQARWGTHGDHPIIVLAAATTLDCFDLTVQAFNLSGKYRTPLILLTDEVVAHTREKVVLPSAETVEVVDRLRPAAPPEWYVPYVRGYVPLQGPVDFVGGILVAN
jgi:2-oxoglutarate ferredoxin oxidoreductase subunit alpha